MPNHVHNIKNMERLWGTEVLMQNPKKMGSIAITFSCNKPFSVKWMNIEFKK